MKDRMGLQLEKGNLVHVTLGDKNIVAKVLDLVPGGMSLALASGGQEQQVTPDKLVVELEVFLTDGMPGQNHAPVIRLINPEKEAIVKKAAVM